MTACIVGWGHTRFGRLEKHSLESLIVSAVGEAIRDAEVEPGDIDAIFVGNMNGGLVPQNFISSLPLQFHPDLRFKPATRLENACASGSAAVYQGLNYIEAGKGSLVLVVGAEKMTSVPGTEVTRVLANASYTPEEADRGMTFPGIFALIAEQYYAKHGDKSDVLAQIAAKNHYNGSLNPYAHIQKDLGFDFCRTVSEANPVVAPPLRKTDCSTVADGAAAVVLSDVRTALGMRKAVFFRAARHLNDFLPMSRRDVSDFEGPRLAWKKAMEQAQIGIRDLSFAEVHDCFTIAELLTYEAMGLTPAGQGERAILEGWTALRGSLPVNPSGGLKAKGHAIGATGVSMHVMAAMQLTNRAGKFQVPNAALGAVFNMGGAAVANYVSILEPLRA
ncbi:MAG: acetyl-CoA acetyltransferase [Betaproteobacteria bacterium]|nr:acetyl-CoA acetyltransferase [Betaproteobacteria bacterium]